MPGRLLRTRSGSCTPPARRAWYLLNQGEGVFIPADDLETTVRFDIMGDKVLAMLMTAANRTEQVAERVE